VTLVDANVTMLFQPPGTGKTTTICSLVKACLAKRAHPVADPSRTERLTKPKILICAPSNAAIDEVASRLKDKVEHVIRLGAGASINVKVKDISLDALIDEKMASTSTSKDALKGVGNQVRDLRAQLDAVKALRQQKEDEFAQIHDNIERSRVLDDEIRKLKQQRTNLTHQMDKLKDQQRDGSRTMDALRRRFRTDVMQEADVICSTLSGAGHDLLEQFDSFEMIIIDEAAQAVELSSLIPLKYRSKRCVMVGGAFSIICLKAH
jgi:senataxin